ncbi:MAG: radical SAM protein [Bacteroidetes bacterium]|nr:radical SAM protein [Bacteroidota bacterium]
MIISYKNVFNNSLRLFKALSFRRSYNYLKIILGYYYSRIIKKPIVLADPFSITFEVSSICNLTCPQCIVGRNETIRNQPFISNEFVNSTLNQFSGNSFYASFYHQGEPLLNKDVFDLIKTAKRLNYYTYLSTNGLLLTKDIAKKIINSGLDKIIISIDGTDQNTYSFYRQGGSLELVKCGVQKLLKLRLGAKNKTPYIVMQYMVNKKNEADLKHAKKFAYSLGVDKLEFKSMQVYDEKDAYLPQNKKYNRYAASKKRKNSCFRLWSHAIFTSDNNAIVCCNDKIPLHIISSEIKSNSFWYSKELLLIRKNILAGNHPEICNNCFI